MSFLTVDQNRCKRDHICVAECPIKLIRFKEPDSFPGSVKGAEQYCISCGHCVAVCPTNALTVSTVNSTEFLPFNPDLLPKPDQIEHFLKSRRSIRSFKDKKVDRLTLEKLIDISSYAPSGHNVQPVHWMVIQDKNQVHRIAELVVDWMHYAIDNMPELAAAMFMKAICSAWNHGSDRICRDAPHLIIAHAPASNSFSQGSCTLALSYLELAAHSMELGACWAGYVEIAAASFPPLMQELALPESHMVYGAMMIGYPKYRYHKIPSRTVPRILWR
ncbi:MAG: nitroreductase family protein [Syntrophomonas sp.]|nr:nitroreductase family protein [Syntrophomonas sp.]